ncbi:MAG: BrnT family toxin [Polaromonas sp.]
MDFEWDFAKAARNLVKHGVSFETAARVFADPFAMTRQDRIEAGQQRWQTLGMADGLVLLLVAHTVREDDSAEVIRLISARRADPTERKRYEQETR